MPKLNPYEAPQSKLQAERSFAPRTDIARSIRVLNALQLMLMIAIAISFLFGVKTSNWMWPFLRTLFYGLTMNSTLLFFLAWWNRAWMIFVFSIVTLSVSGLLLYAMTQVELLN